MRQYRKYFQDYYGIKLNKNYDIHHIDLNHENNQISNLMILPKKLHNKYHILINSTNFTGDIFCKTFNAKIHSNIVNGDNYNLYMSQQLIEVLYECNKWYDYKLYLDGEILNIHNIELGCNNVSNAS